MSTPAAAPPPQRPSVRALVVDDEPPARRRLLRLLGEYAHVTATHEAPDLATAAARWHHVDVVFLDIQLQQENALESLARRRMGGPAGPLVVLVTAFADFAVRAFSLDVTDYLLKPVTRARLAETMTRVDRRMGGLSNFGLPAAGMAGKPVALHDRGRLLLLQPDEVERFEADGNYVRVHSTRGILLHRERILELEARLDPETFVRIHRSAIVNTTKIRALRPWMNGDHVAELASGADVRWSRHYRDALQRYLLRVGASQRMPTSRTDP